MHTTSHEAVKRYVEKMYAGSSRLLRVLDIGSYDCNGTYKDIFNGSLIPDFNWIYTGMDTRPGPNVDIVCRDLYSWPELDCVYPDLIISGQCLEHVPMPWVWIKEIARICTPGGHILLVAPWRAPYHKAPVDCWRILPDGAIALLEWADLIPVEITMERNAETLDDITQTGKSWGDDTLIVARKP